MIQTIKAVHFDGTGQSCDDLLALFGGPDPEKCIWKGCTNKGGFLRTVSGTTEFSPGDWIVVEPDGSTHVLTDHFTLAGRKLGLVPSMLLAHLAESGFDPVYGARPLKRAIQQELENPLAQAILSGKAVPGRDMELDLVDGALVIRQ